MPKPPDKPPLSIVSTETASISPPRPLGPHGSSLWQRVQREYAVTDCGGVEMLTQICEAVDRLRALRAAIDADGEVIRTRTGVPRAHPALRDEVQLRAFVIRTIEKLGLNFEPIKHLGGQTK
jgi:hypothetical protein